MKHLEKIQLVLLAITFSVVVKGQGCFLKTTDSDVLTSLSNTCGNTQIDNALRVENNVLRTFFGINCAFYFYNDESGKNAMFTSNVVDDSMQDGTIIFGVNLLNEQLTVFNNFGAGGGIPFILAHEIGHAKAHKMGWHFSRTGTIKKDELFADFCAGIFMHYRSYMISTDIQNALLTFFQLGDFKFNNPSHHGMPQERYNAIQAGYNFMQNFKTQFPSQLFTDQTLFQSAKNYLDQFVIEF